MNVDLRGFAYAMQPLFKRQEWRADACLRSLAAATEALRVAALDCEEQAQACKRHADFARQSWLDRADPGVHQRRLAHLARQLERREELQAVLRERREALEQARLAWVASRQKLEGVRRHRQDCEDGYVALEGARMLARADDEWIVRPQALAGPQPGEAAP